MGPRPEGHGEEIRGKVQSSHPKKLQWGHVQKDMERDLFNFVSLGRSGASMGPRPEGHGEIQRSKENSPRRYIASMGPRPEGHGELGLTFHLLTTTLCFNGATSRRTWRGVGS